VAVLCVVMDPTMGIVFGCVVGLFQNSEKQSRGANVTTIGSLAKSDAAAVEDNEYSAQVGGTAPPSEDAPLGDKISYTLATMFCDPEADDTDHHHGHDSAAATEVLTYSFAGTLSFVNVGQHVARVRRYLHQRTDVAAYVLSLEATHYLDVDGLLGLQEIVKEIEQAGKNGVVVVGTRGSVVELTSKSEWIASLRKNKRVFTSNGDAVAWFRTLAGSSSSSSSVGVVIDNGAVEPVSAVLRGNGKANGSGAAMYPVLERKK